MFNATNTAPMTGDDATLENHPFYPDLAVADFRKAMRVDSLATPERAEFALRSALMEVNRRLIAFQRANEHLLKLANVPAAYGQPADEKRELYRRAVFALAKASLIERYRDYDSSAKAQGRADQLEENIDELRRDAAWAISDLVGRSRATVELV